MKKYPDQNQIVALTESLGEQAAQLENSLRAAGIAVPMRPALEAGKDSATALKNFDGITAHMESLNVLVRTSLQSRASMQQQEPPDRNAPAVPGPLPQPAAIALTPVVVVRPSPYAQIGSWNPDEQILKLRGVKTLEELNARQFVVPD